MLRAVAEHCLAHSIPCQVAVEEMMACGLGVCWTCAVPLIALDGRGWWNVRACTEGPVFNGARVWWDRWLGPKSGEGPVAGSGEGFDAMPESQTVEAWPG
jgi:dihydroorotate dehydrogenase electron transfer subunit